MTRSSIPLLHTKGMLREVAPHPGLPLIVSSPRMPLRVPDAVQKAVRQPRRLSAYLFFWVREGHSVHNLDMEIIRLGKGAPSFTARMD